MRRPARTTISRWSGSTRPTSASVNPSVPGYGGPTGVGEPGSPGADVYSYGNSSLRFGVSQTSPKQGKLVETTPEGWSHTVYTATPGIPGDSGSGFLSSTGAAFGTLSTVAIAPLPLSNGVSDLSQELGYARANSSFSGVSLVPGTEPFSSTTRSAASPRPLAVPRHRRRARLRRARRRGCLAFSAVRRGLR